MATWSGTQVWPDGSVPRRPRSPWLEYGIWRGQPESIVSGSDLRPAVVDHCEGEDGELRLSVRLENLGPQDARAGASLSVYGLDESGEVRLLKTFTTGDWLDSGTAGASWTLTTDVETAARGLRLVAGDAGDGALPRGDCDPGNNVLEWSL